MAENVTPVTLEVKDFKAREVILVDYKFNQATDREGQISGIPRGGRINIERHRLLLREVQGVLGRR